MVNQNAVVVFLTLSLAPTVSSLPVASAVPSACPAPAADVAYSGNGIGYALVADASTCCAACANVSLCAAWTLMPSQPLSRCFLKSAPSNPRAEAGAISGTVTGATPSACPFGTTPCRSGACALFASWCDGAGAKCGAGTSVCPDGSTCVPSARGWAGCPALPPWLDAALGPLVRAKAVVGAITNVSDLALQLSNKGYGSGAPGPPGFPSLAIPPYNWLNEGLHGVARGGLATSFPQVSVIGCTFNRSVFAAMGRTLASEARAKYAMWRRVNDTTDDYTGVTFYAPNLNIGRDQRWGRIQEVVSEDPFLTSIYGYEVVTAAQAPIADGSGSSTPGIAACCKHMAVYSFESYNGTERAAQNAVVNGRDLLETYLPAFQTCVRDARGSSIMCSYNAVNGVPTCASSFLLNVTARARYNLSGWIMSDYGAVADTYSSHHYCTDADTCTMKALRVGVDQDGGGAEYATAFPGLVASGALALSDVQLAASRLFSARAALGLLDAPENAPYRDLSPEAALDTDANRALSLDAARQGIVLMKNDGAALPLSSQRLAGVAIVGPNADVPDVLYGNYQGTPPFLVTPRMGLEAVLAPGTVAYAPGCADVACESNAGFAAALAIATAPSTTALVGVFGIDQGEEREGHDRSSLNLPGRQDELITSLAAVMAARKLPFVLVLVSGGPVNVSAHLASAAVPAVVLLGYASQSAGTALADVLLGAYAPAGKLAVTWLEGKPGDLPDFADMALAPHDGGAGRTYRYTTATPLLPFGHGLTYTTWSYAVAPLTSPVMLCSSVALTAMVRNTGTVDSSEVVQAYVSFDASAGAGGPYPAPRLALAGFERIFVRAGEAANVTLIIAPRSLARVNASATATFGQDFSGSDSPTAAARAASGAAYGVEGYAAAAAASGRGPIGWDDLWAVVPGVVRVWVGSGQPGFGAPGDEVEFLLGGDAPVNLATCV